MAAAADGAAAAAVGAAAGSGGGASAAGRQIEAFTVQPVLDEKRVLCLEAWSNYLLIGLAGGLWLRAGGAAPRTGGRTALLLPASLKTWLLPPFSPHHVAPQMAPCYSPPSGPPAAAVPTGAMPPQAQQAAAVRLARSRGSGSGQWCSRCAALPAGG